MENVFIKPELWETFKPVEMLKVLKRDEFKNESHFCDVIEANMQITCKNLFDAKYMSHKREYALPSPHNRKLAADFLLITEEHRILIECKVPKGAGQTAVAQMMKYIVVSEKAGLKIDRYVCLTTGYNPYDHAMLNRFKLPIEVYFISKERAFTVYPNN